MNKVDVTKEIGENFLTYALDTNVNKAFPNVKDGLKPGQRCILWEMYTKKYTSDKPHVKSAKIDGGVAALYWPHGTQAIYETFARMSQPFTNNVPEVDFHGANGNVILGGDAIAADRYTEARLSKITEEFMLNGIEKNTVPMVLNFSEDEYMPVVLPSYFPRLLVNGAQGIGVSIANNWLPHNLKETINLIGKYVKTGKFEADEYYPDFPTGCTIVNKDELSSINETGKGKVIVEATYNIDGNEITFTEMPYQVYIEPLIVKIKELIESEDLIGIKDVYNKSDKNGIALVVECQRGYAAEDVLQQLFQATPLRSQYNVNQNGIISKTPMLLNLQQTVDEYLFHCFECLKRETEYDKNLAAQRKEILEGLKFALINIDKIIEIIRSSNDKTNAANELKKEFEFTDRQTKSILSMPLMKLTKLDTQSIEKELTEKNEIIAKCDLILNNKKELDKVFLSKIKDMGRKYSTPRRTKVVQKEITKTKKAKSSAPKENRNFVIAFNPLGYLQKVSPSKYKSDGSLAFTVSEDRKVALFSNKGRFFRIALSDIKECGPKDKGTAIGAIINLDNDEKIITIHNDVFVDKPYMFFVTEDGKVKKCEGKQFAGGTRNVKGSVAFKTNSKIVSIQETNGCVVTLTSTKRQISFMADSVRASSIRSGGMCGIKLDDDDKIVSMTITEPQNFTGKIANKGGRGTIL